MEFLLLDSELSESRLFRSSRQFGMLDGTDIANLLYLNTVITYMISQDDEQSEFAKYYANETVKYGTYALFRTHATDMYMLAYAVLHPDSDYLKFSRPLSTKKFLEGLQFNRRMHIQFMRKIAQGKSQRSEAISYLYRLETQLKIKDSRYKSWRRLISDWGNLRYSQKQYVVTKIAQEMRRLGGGSARNSELMRAITPMLKYRSYKDKAPVDTNKNTAGKLAGALAGAVAGRYVAGKLSQTDQAKAKNIGTGIGAVAGYWAAGRKKV